MNKEPGDEQVVTNEPVNVYVTVEQGGQAYCRMRGRTSLTVTADSKMVDTKGLAIDGLAWIDRGTGWCGDDEYDYERLEVNGDMLDGLLEAVFDRLGKPKRSEWKVEVSGHYGTHANRCGDALCAAKGKVWKFSVDMSPKEDEWDERDAVFPSVSNKSYRDEHGGGCGWY